MPDDTPTTMTATRFDRQPLPEAEIELEALGPKATAFEAGARVAPIVPRTLNELAMVAAAIIKAGLAPDSYMKDHGNLLPDDKIKSRVMVGIMYGAEVGYPPITALRTIAIINGRPSLWGDGAVGLIQVSGKLEKMTIEEIGPLPGASLETGKFADDYGVRVAMWRVGQSEPYVGQFTVGDAKRAHLWMQPKRTPWIEHPRRMLKWRAFSQPASDGFADCLQGLLIREVAEDLPPEAPARTDTDFLNDTPALPAPSEQPVADALDDQMERVAALIPAEPAQLAGTPPVQPLKPGSLAGMGEP